MARVVVYDRADPSRRVTVERAHWRATLQLLYRDEVLPKERVGRLDWRLGGAGTSISRDECVAIAAYIAASLLPCIKGGEGVAVPDRGPVFDEVTDGTIGGGGLALTVNGTVVPAFTTLPQKWLEEFADFLTTTEGVGALEESFEHRLQDGLDTDRPSE